MQAYSRFSRHLPQTHTKNLVRRQNLRAALLFLTCKVLGVIQPRVTVFDPVRFCEHPYSSRQFRPCSLSYSFATIRTGQDTGPQKFQPQTAHFQQPLYSLRLYDSAKHAGPLFAPDGFFSMMNEMWFVDISQVQIHGELDEGPWIENSPYAVHQSRCYCICCLDRS